MLSAAGSRKAGSPWREESSTATSRTEAATGPQSSRRPSTEVTSAFPTRKDAAARGPRAREGKADGSGEYGTCPVLLQAVMPRRAVTVGSTASPQAQPPPSRSSNATNASAPPQAIGVVGGKFPAQLRRDERGRRRNGGVKARRRESGGVPCSIRRATSRVGLIGADPARELCVQLRQRKANDAPLRVAEPPRGQGQTWRQ